MGVAKKLRRLPDDIGAHDGRLLELSDGNVEPPLRIDSIKAVETGSVEVNQPSCLPNTTEICNFESTNVVIIRFLMLSFMLREFSDKFLWMVAYHRINIDKIRIAI